MRIRVGDIEALYRYPVKSMRGEPLEVAERPAFAHISQPRW